MLHNFLHIFILVAALLVPDFKPGGGTRTHDTVLLEWTARNPAADTYDGAAPSELIRFEQPFANHNAGH